MEEIGYVKCKSCICHGNCEFESLFQTTKEAFKDSMRKIVKNDEALSEYGAKKKFLLALDVSCPKFIPMFYSSVKKNYEYLDCGWCQNRKTCKHHAMLKEKTKTFRCDDFVPDLLLSNI